MRKSRDGADTRQRVLESAQELFASRGFKGTSLSDITDRCGISDGLILHHFKSKHNLYRQVQDRLAKQYSQLLEDARDMSSTPEQAIQETLLAAFNFWKQDSSYERISLWAYLEGQNEFVEKETALTAGLARGIKQMQDKGLIDNHYSPLVLLTMVIGPIHFWIRYRELFREALGLSITVDELDQQFLDQIIKLVKDIFTRKDL
ncbi:MAG: TetR/AcrR family transcriptional regulator [Candidatus Aminicenantes bacterium]|nr:TetR/AcrR family transcriptional regulator [Candidatus Aminicenantes bacterium]